MLEIKQTVAQWLEFAFTLVPFLQRSAKSILKNMYLRLIPFKSLFFKKFHLISDNDLGIDYQCLVFQKVSEDSRDWKWDKPF